MSKPEVFVFDSHGHNAPAYGCNKPSDNSGEYVRLTDHEAIVRKLGLEINQADFNYACHRDQIEQEKRECLDELLWVIRNIRNDLPSSRDWLDPVIEKRLDFILAKNVR